jgi:hypothetical protein
LSFIGLTESDKNLLTKEIFNKNDILKYVDPYDLNIDSVKDFIKNNFEPEDFIDIDYEASTYWR